MAVSPAEDVIRFGLFELDLKAGQLSRNGTKLRLPQQPLQLLAMLLERPGEILTRDELRQRLWSSDVFVDFDHGLNKSIQKLRDALGDSATSPRYIETIPRVGYRFIAPVRNGTRPLEPEVAIKIERPRPCTCGQLVNKGRDGGCWLQASALESPSSAWRCIFSPVPIRTSSSTRSSPISLIPRRLPPYRRTAIFSRSSAEIAISCRPIKSTPRCSPREKPDA